MKNILISLLGLLYCSISILATGWLMQYIYVGYTPMNLATFFVGCINASAGMAIIAYGLNKGGVI